MDTTQALVQTLDSFTPISLETLNTSASFLDRINTKYIVHVSQLPDIISTLKEHFSVLNIKDKTVFNYDNVYMDTKDYLFYQQHEAGQNSRSKIRTRHYMDADNLAFFEYKHKENKVQRKYRYQCELTEHGEVTPTGLTFYHDLWHSIYPGEEIQYITPSMGTRYKRFTLCSNDSSERLTIDFAINLIELRDPATKGKVITLPDVAIIESKSMSLDCLSHKLMEKFGIPQAQSCSKYGLSIYYHGHAQTRDRFQHTIDTIESIKKSTPSDVRAHFIAQKAVPTSSE